MFCIWEALRSNLDLKTDYKERAFFLALTSSYMNMLQEHLKYATIPSLSLEILFLLFTGIVQFI